MLDDKQDNKQDELYMARALKLAQRGRQ